MKKHQILIIWAAAILIIGLVGFVFLKNRLVKKVATADNKSEASQSEASPAQSTGSADEKIVNTPQGNITVPKNLPEGVNVSSLKPVNGEGATANFIAVADIHNFALVVEAKIEESASGKNYWVWIAKDPNLGNLFKVGMLEKNNDIYSINFNKSADFSTYKYVMVTEESKDDNIPETKILEGVL